MNVGANFGNYTKLIQKEADQQKLESYKIHLFEPLSDCYSKLDEIFQGNDKVIINKFACSSKNSSQEIFYNKDCLGLTSLYERNLKMYDLELGEKTTIQTQKLSNYIEENSIKHINFIKMDTEGHELEVLNGMGSYLNPKFVDFIQFEYGGANLDSKTSLMEIFYLLEDKGFKITKVMKNGLEHRKYEPFLENFENANYIAIGN